MNARDTIRYRTAELVRGFLVQLSALRKGPLSVLVDYHQARHRAEDLAMSIDLLHAEEKAKENGTPPPAGHPSQTPGGASWFWTPEADDKGTPEKLTDDAIGALAARMVMAPEFRRLFPRSALAVVLDSDHPATHTSGLTIILPAPKAR